MEDQLLHEQAQSILHEELADHRVKLCGCDWKKEKEGLLLETKDLCYTQMWALGIISDREVVEDTK